jgi:hypothetical protein
VRIRLASAPALPEHIEYTLEWFNADVSPFVVGTASGTDTFDLNLPCAGEYELTWSVRSSVTAAAIYVWQDETCLVHVLDSGALPQAFEAILDPQAVQAALQELAGMDGRNR